MAFKNGVILGPILFNDTGSGTTAIGATSNSGTISIGNGSSGAININCGTAGINIGATANAHTTTLGSTNTTSATVIQSGSGNIAMNSGFTVDSTGRTTNTVQPAFHAFLTASTANNVTGDGTIYTIVFDGEHFDVGSSFNTGTGTFTAPKTGKYMFVVNLMTTNSVGSQTTGQLLLVTTARTYQSYYDNPTTVKNTGNFYGKQLTIIADMTASDTAIVQLQMSGSTKTVGIFGDATGTYTNFCGYLVA